MRYLIAIFLLFSGPAYGQSIALRNYTPATQKTLLLSAPVYMGEEYGVRVEYNLGGGTVALEGVRIGRGEEFNQQQKEEEGLSLVTEGYEAALHVSRFSQPWVMGGFYWSMAIGYRQLEGRWRRPTPDGYSFVDDEEVAHQMIASGFTGRGRLGYRYQSSRYPLAVGGAIGLRHFENRFEDRDTADNPPTTGDERRGLSRMIMTRPEFVFELGVAL